jgi:hypothetical protein
MTDLTSLSPSEIDELWAPIADRQRQALVEGLDAERELGMAQALVDAPIRITTTWAQFEVDRAKHAVETLPARIEKLLAKETEARIEQEPFKAEWNRRGGWTRAYLVVTNGQGHVHRTTSCSSCYPTTQFVWLTELSGADEQEIVDQAGERACTHCYASAPVALRLDRPTQLFSEDEKRRQAERDERAAKKAAAEAEKITVAGYHDFGHTTTKIFKTTRAATNAIASDLSSLTWYGETHPYAAGWKANIENIRKALADKGAEYDYDKALAAARKKTVREGRQAQF